MSSKFCPECGVKAPSIAAKFCSSCGNSLDAFAPKKAPATKQRVQASYDEDDEDGSDVTELPDISALKYNIESDADLGIGGSSFTFGKNGFEPVKMAITRRR